MVHLMGIRRARRDRREEEYVPEGRLNVILEQTHRWLRENKFKGPARLLGRVRLMVMLGSDYLSGEYTRIPVFTIWTIIFALLYVVGPVDLIPDFIPGLGWLDDAFLVSLVFRAVSRDLRKYCEEKELNPKHFGL